MDKIKTTLNEKIFNSNHKDIINIYFLFFLICIYTENKCKCGNSVFCFYHTLLLYKHFQCYIVSLSCQWMLNELWYTQSIIVIIYLTFSCCVAFISKYPLYSFLSWLISIDFLINFYWSIVVPVIFLVYETFSSLSYFFSLSH